ncbi:MAG: ATP-binding protein [Nanoarchaeota archaeon]
MIVGRIIGKTTTNRFEFSVEHDVKKFDYCQVYHKDYGYVLCQVMELERTSEALIGKSVILGYKDENNNTKQIRNPFDVNTEVLKADEGFIKSIIVGKENTSQSAFIGRLEGTEIDIFIELNKLLTKHVAVLAKSGSGKSYTVGVLLEEIIERNIPLVVIDPHGEYSELKKPNNNEEDLNRLNMLNLKPKAYNKKITEYGDPEIDEQLRPLKLNDKLQTQELIDLLPTKLTNNQQALLYSTIKNIEEISFESLIHALEATESNLKWNLISSIEYLKALNLFSSFPTSYNEIVQPGKGSIINLKGMDPEVQQIIVYKLVKDLFQERKRGSIPPFFLAIEEAHNFVPEKGFSDAKSSKVIKNIASEGRKFGLGLCVVSQRPAIVQKTVLSQCTTQMIMKITNPNDLKAVSSSVEGITSETEDELKNLPIGTSLVTGVVDKPLIVNIRPRKSLHGGESVDILQKNEEEEEDFVEDIKEFKEQNIMPLIVPNITKEDVRLMTGNENIKTTLIPCVLFKCKNRTIEYNLLMDMKNGRIIYDISDTNLKGAFLPELEDLSKKELKLLETAYNLKTFNLTDLLYKSGLSLDSKNDLKELVKKGYIEQLEQEQFRISESYIFSNPARYGFHGKIEYKSINYDKRDEKNKRLDVMKAKVAKFTNIIDNKECYLVHYES